MGNKIRAISKLINVNSNESQPGNDNLQQESKGIKFGEDSVQQQNSNSMESVFYLPHTAVDGDKVTVKGEMSSETNEFSIILATGTNLNDYSLRFACHFDLIQNITSLRIMQNEELVIVEKDNPFSKDDETWDLAITIKDDRVILDIDGSTHSIINLMHPLSDIRVMHVTGNVKSVTSLSYEFARSNMAEEN